MSKIIEATILNNNFIDYFDDKGGFASDWAELDLLDMVYEHLVGNIDETNLLEHLDFCFGINEKTYKLIKKKSYKQYKKIMLP